MRPFLLNEAVIGLSGYFHRRQEPSVCQASLASLGSLIDLINQEARPFLFSGYVALFSQVPWLVDCPSL